MGILFLIYDLVFFCGLILYLPLYIYRKKINLPALKEKFGFLSAENLKNSIWIQVVSVGEVNVIGQFIQRLREISNSPIVITTTTLTGNALAKNKYSNDAKIFFFPYDISVVISRFLKIIKPQIFIAVETEIWPNLFFQLKRKRIPIVIINGRISDKAFRRYCKIRPLLKWALNYASHIGTQNDYYRNRFIDLGCKDESVNITGNMKFESIFINHQRLSKLKEELFLKLKDNNRFLIVAGSTHYPEEEIIVQGYKKLLEAKKQVSLLIAPRHIDRIAAIKKQIHFLGFDAVKISELKDGTAKSNTGLFLLDTIGELLYFYAFSDICFVGGSLSNYGGHNILEPIYFLKPTIFGPHMDNFKDVEEIILAKGAAIQVKNNFNLNEVLLQLTDDEALRSNLRQKCLNVFEEERKGLEKNLNVVVKYLKY